MCSHVLPSMFKHSSMFRFLLLIALFPLCGFSQINKDYQGLLWKISGNGLDEPSYLYGTMHVSNRVAFHLSETFFDAIDNADIIALETNPDTWVKDMTSSSLYRDYVGISFQFSGPGVPLYESFIPNEPQQQELEYYLSRDQDLLNNLLYRLNTYEQDFSENTYLDLFIFQAGMKSGKKIVPLEDYEESFKQVMMSSRRDKDAVYITPRQAEDMLGDYSDWQMLLDDAYRRGDLDLLDTTYTLLYPGKYYKKYMLHVRNAIMVEGMDSLMNEGVLFTGVGAAHLPGDQGVINLLRQKGYTVEPVDRAVTATSISRKDGIDEVIHTTELRSFESDDHFVRTRVPGEMTKLLSKPFQEYVFADMVNGGYYSLRRINTFGMLNGKDENFYFGKLDSMLFENIPGKILSKDTIEVSGYPALEIRNETRTGDHQHYQIVCTPLEILIFKVGGHKEFANSELPEAFFKNIELRAVESTEKYQPNSGGLEVNLPGRLRTELYPGVFEEANNTFWAQSYDEGDYYAVGVRQYYDFSYLEEDDFELTYMVEKWADERDLEIDELTVEGGELAFSRFELSTKKGTYYGEVHIQGPKYVMLITTAEKKAKRNDFFSSFQFTPFVYSDEFVEYKDSVYHIVMESPVDLNNYDSFFEGLMGGAVRGAGNSDFEGEHKTSVLEYIPTGEDLLIEFTTLPKYASMHSVEEFWEFALSDLLSEKKLTIASDSTLYTIEKDGYFSQAKAYTFTAPNTERVIKAKLIVENAALYGIYANVQSADYHSEFVDRAFASFRPSDDTIIGLPITMSKADLFFEALDSHDSTQVYQASKSVRDVWFGADDSERIKEYLSNYVEDGFTRRTRLALIHKLSTMDNVNANIPYLEDLYYEKLDSSSYQFEILETLLEFDTKEAVESFNKLILDEPPFTTNEYTYSSLFHEFNDSLELAPSIYPDILTLADFEDYRLQIYDLLADLLDSGLVEGSDYQLKYETLLLFAKVELKKQHAKDEVQRGLYGSSSSTNRALSIYTKLLTPYKEEDEVQDHFRKIASIRSKRVLAELLVVTDPHEEVEDSTWSFVASDPKAFYKVYPYLQENDKLDLLEDQYQSRDALAKSILANRNYRNYDSISFIQSEKIDIKPCAAEVFFFRAKNDDDQLWRLFYVVVEDKEVMDTEYVIIEEAETYNESHGILDEIIEDALDDIRLYDRERASTSNPYMSYY
ncbi:TraB/GumN family protein [Phaeocystidibacter marisrubri]|uniref:TraB/GumN family protein n=2 Tax=Phaeocystidibacter marisrubri TaxID=1577780 RepID=A0A6L3ZC21_9FLAO|nr:TraB/GumN family protein [Phaeocystidibacter marisrubri]